ncbi:MAG TPA: hydroxymethylbilane synthase [Povalibacter sp.]|nr:hydroxymethylbilane synthase [Povalibacter sp.]
MSTLPPLRIATRQSRLALWQAEHVASQLRERHPDLNVVLVPMTTQGDRVLDRPLAQVGGKGLFIKELEIAIADNRADIAVHSMKDVPSELPPGMLLAAMLARADARDAFISQRHANFQLLPQGARVGTSSLRRQCQLKALRPDLEIVPLRGNVDTRLRKLDEGQYDAIILAAAGLTRLGFAQRITHHMDFDHSLPAVGQGVIGIECRADDARSIALAAVLDDRSSRLCCESERAFALRLQGSCQSPIAGYAELHDGQLQLRGVVGSEDGRTLYRGTQEGPATDPLSLGIQLADRLLSAGADVLLAAQRAAGAAPEHGAP